MMTRRSLALAALVAVLLGSVFAMDTRFLPQVLPRASAYSIPMLVAAQFLSPRLTALFASSAVALYIVSTVVRGVPIVAAEWRELSLLAVAYLSYLLARRIREADEARRRAEEAKEQLQNFIALVAHDLRNPLATILGYVQLLGRSKTIGQEPEQALLAMRAQGQRMERLLSDLLDSARIGAGRFQVEPEPADLVEIAQQVVEAEVTATHRQIDLDAPDHLAGAWDPGRLEQVLHNLVSNAIKYSSEGQAVTVELSRADDYAVLRVTDPGIGMRPEDLPLLFQPFSRLYSARAAHGNGLGLYITKGIVEAHGGQISVESRGPGRGSSFTVTLPLETPASGGVIRRPAA